jgi:uncharacterized protein YjdB
MMKQKISTSLKLALVMVCAITVTSCSKIGSVIDNVTGTTADPTSVSINETNIVISVDEQVKLTSTTLPSDANNDVEWYSSNTTIADITTDGLLLGIAPGNVTINIYHTEDETLQDTLIISVVLSSDPETYVSPTSVTLSDTEYTIAVNGSYQLNATVLPSSANQTVIWQSSNPSVVSVSSSGLIQGEAFGDATIYAYTYDNTTLYTSIDVSVDGVTSDETDTEEEEVDEEDVIELSSDTTIYTFGAYEAEHDNTITVQVNRTEDIALVLTAYESVNWDIEAIDSASITAIFTAGYETQTVTVPDSLSDVPIYSLGRIYNYLDSTATDIALTALLGQSTTIFEGAYRGDTFIVPEVIEETLTSLFAPESDEFLGVYFYDVNSYGNPCSTSLAKFNWDGLVSEQSVLDAYETKDQWTFKSVIYSSIDDSFYSISSYSLDKVTETGKATNRIDYAAHLSTITYNTDDHVIYYSSFSGAGYLVEYDPQTEETTTLFSLNNKDYVTMSYNPEDQTLYGITVQSDIVQLDLTGTILSEHSNAFNIGISSHRYMKGPIQSQFVDGKLAILVQTSSGMDIYRYDPADGSLTHTY